MLGLRTHSKDVAQGNPAEQELRDALTVLRVQNPALGISKLHALLLMEHPTWLVSEKRTRKFLQSQGLVLSPAGKQQPQLEGDLHPISRLIEGLDTSQYSKKIKAQYFDRVKGKGLVATEKIDEGEVVWKEDPFILAPEWYVILRLPCQIWRSLHKTLYDRSIYDLQSSSVACAHCSTPLNGSPLNVPCPGNSKAPSCPARFCTRLCLSRSNRIHPLLCVAQNPASGRLLAFAKSREWMAFHALAQCTSRVLLSEQQGDSAFESDWAVMRGLAQLGMEERVKGGWSVAPYLGSIIP